jgi:hypothetical protein
VGNRKITNEPPTYRLHCNHWLSIWGVEEEFPSVETWGVNFFEIGTRFCRSTDILNFDIVQEIIENGSPQLQFKNPYEIFKNPKDEGHIKSSSHHITNKFC